MNVALLKRIRKHILEEPRRFVMRTWYLRSRSGEGTYVSDNYELTHRRNWFAKCGTAACIGGWACILGDPKTPVQDVSDIRATAADLLGFDSCGRQYSLFAVDEWPIRYKRAFQKETTVKGRAEIAARAINNYIKTNGWTD